MTPPMTKEQLDAIYDLYYNKGYTVGRDRLYRVMRNAGYNVSVRQVRDWLRRQYVAQLYYPVRRIKPMTSTVAKTPGSQVGIDLADMRQNAYNGFKYILTGIDLHSKYAFAIPLKNKKASTVLNGIKEMLEQAEGVGLNIRSIRSDNGSEFVADEVKKMLKQKGIKQVLSTPGNPRSNGQVERFNGILKRWLRMRMKAEQSKNWAEMLPSTLEVYNTTTQETIGMTPTQALTAESQEVVSRIEKTVKHAQPTPTLSKGDRVRVRIKFTKDTDKALDGIQWSPRVFTVSGVRKSDKPWVAPTYTLENHRGRYYGEELQKVDVVENERDEPERFEISKLVRRSVRDGVPGFIVKWKGYPKASDNTWEPEEALMEDVPQLVEAFNKG
ncbi:MAG: hypothetical protein Salg2KO_10200 [Salibacteraceae bacterium]